MTTIEDQTDYVLQNKIISKETIIETLSKKADRLTDDLKNLLEEILQATTELSTMTELSDATPSNQDTVTGQTPTKKQAPEPSQPESHEDEE